MPEEKIYIPDIDEYSESAAKRIPDRNERPVRQKRTWQEVILDIIGFNRAQLSKFAVRAAIISVAFAFVACALYTMYIAIESEHNQRVLDTKLTEICAAYDDTQNKIKTMISDNDIASYAEDNLHWVKSAENNVRISGDNSSSFTK